MLKLVQPTQPSHKQAVIERIKKMPRPDGLIQCPTCGGRTILNTVTGAFIKNGRKTGGTKTDVDVCYHCERRGIFTPMLPERPKLIK